MRAGRLGVSLALILVASLVGSVPPASGQSPVPSPALEIPIPDDLTPDSISAISDELLTADLERFGVAVFDPELPAILAQLRDSAAADFSEILAEQPGPPAVEDEDGSDDEEYDEEGRTGLTASIAGAPPVATRSQTFDQGIALTSVLSLATLELVKYLENFHPQPGSTVYEPEPYTKTKTETVDGRDVTTDERVTIRHEVDGSTVTLTHTMQVKYVIPGRDGRPPVTASEAGTAKVRIDTCPSEAGVVRGRIETGSESSFSATDGPGYVAQFTGSDDLSAVVDEQANVAYSRHRATAQRRATGHRPAFGSQPAASTDSSIVAVHEHENGVGGQVSNHTWVPQEQGADEADGRLTGDMIGLTREFADMTLKAAPTVWRSGRCLKVTASPGGRTVQPGSGTSIDVEIEHLADRSEVQRKVRASLSGPGQVTPGDPIDAPGSVTYRAPTDEGVAAITFKVTSNRGIAEVRETYKTDSESCPGEAVRLGDGLAVRPGLAARSDVAITDVRIAQADEDCPGTIVLQGTVTGTETTHIENPYGDSDGIMQATMQVTFTRTADDWWVSGTADLFGEYTGDCHRTDSASGDFGWDMRQQGADPDEVDANGWFVGFAPYDSFPEFWDQPLQTFYLGVSAFIKREGGTCGHIDGPVEDAFPDRPLYLQIGLCQSLEVSRVADGQFHGECEETLGDAEFFLTTWTWSVDLTEVPAGN